MWYSGLMLIVAFMLTIGEPTRSPSYVPAVVDVRAGATGSAISSRDRLLECFFCDEEEWPVRHKFSCDFEGVETTAPCTYRGDPCESTENSLVAVSAWNQTAGGSPRTEADTAGELPCHFDDWVPSSCELVHGMCDNTEDVLDALERADLVDAIRAVGGDATRLVPNAERGLIQVKGCDGRLALQVPASADLLDSLHEVLAFDM